MPDSETAVVIASSRAIPTFEINMPVQIAKDETLARSGLIGAVKGHDSKVLAVRAQAEIKTLIWVVEKARVQAKEPLLIAGRQLDNVCKTFVLDLEKEFGRISEVVRVFDDEERKRVREEQRLQELELQRIQREKDAEIERLRQEQLAKETEARRIQEEADRKAREAKAEADRLAAEATNAKQRRIAQEASEAAERARIASEQEKQQAEAAAQRQRAELEARTSQIEEKASDAAYISSKPIGITHVPGQRTSQNWVIVVEQPFVLAKYHPDMVDIKPRLGDIKQALNEGREIKGIKATREFVAGVRIGKAIQTIDV